MLRLVGLVGIIGVLCCVDRVDLDLGCLPDWFAARAVEVRVHACCPWLCIC